MSLGDAINRIGLYIRYGPKYGDTLFEKTIGLWLFWKIWIMTILLLGSLILTGQFFGEVGLIGFFIGIFTMQFIHLLTK